MARVDGFYRRGQGGVKGGRMGVVKGLVIFSLWSINHQTCVFQRRRAMSSVSSCGMYRLFIIHFSFPYWVKDGGIS